MGEFFVTGKILFLALLTLYTTKNIIGTKFAFYITDDSLRMNNGLHISLPGEMRRFVDWRTHTDNLYPSIGEYVRDLIRKDMEAIEKATVYHSILQGMEEAEHNSFMPDSFMQDLMKKYEA